MNKLASLLVWSLVALIGAFAFAALAPFSSYRAWTRYGYGITRLVAFSASFSCLDARLERAMSIATRLTAVPTSRKNLVTKFWCKMSMMKRHLKVLVTSSRLKALHQDTW